MTQPKKVSKTLKEILDTEEMNSILDRSKNIEPVIDEILEWWDFDLYSRNPGPAYTEDGIFKGTDLDMAAFLYALSNRGAVINIPTYERMRKAKVKEGQFIVSDKNRHGEIIGLTANKETFTFSVKIKDMNVIKENGVGDYRNFSLTDMDGSWYEGWKQIEFLPSKDENKFLNEFQIKSNHNTIQFKNFIHPNRWTSFFGQYYFITKALVQRLKEESVNLNEQIKHMLKAGIVYPATSDEMEEKPETIVKEQGKSIKVQAFQVEVDLPENDTKYPVYPQIQSSLIEITKRRKKYVYGIIPKLMFAIRATEYAYYKNGGNKFPAWLKDVKWESNYVEKGKRTKWDRLVLFQPGVGQKGVAIRTRVYEKSTIVSENY